MELDRSEPAINATVTDHHCFGCGAANEVGLRLRFRARPGGGVWAELRPDRRYEGYLGMVHGGILATMLDEAMSWAITAAGDFAVTARMDLAFRSPAAIGRDLRVEGWISRDRKRVLDTAGRVVDVESGDIVAVAEGRFMRVSHEQALAWREAYGVAGTDGNPDQPE